MLIVGGTYREIVRQPASETMFGSGIRAAAALARCGSHTLLSAVGTRDREDAEGTLAAYGITHQFVDRQSDISFVYYTPLSSPRIVQDPSSTVEISDQVNGNTLVFGMLEAEVALTADGLVYDPQNPYRPRPIHHSQLKANRIGIVANATEARQLGNSENVEEAAKAICADSGAEVVVVKRGSKGALVYEASGAVHLVPAFQTRTVWPIGSGDVFSAVFTWAWLEDKRSPADAARLASAATAGWCSTKTLPLPSLSGKSADDLGFGRALPVDVPDVKVYLAGPFFSLAERWLVDLVRQSLLHLGAVPFSPLHDVGLGNDEVAEKDIAGLTDASAVLALLDGADAGTIFETGYAAASGIPTVGFTDHPDRDDFKMLRGLGVMITDDLSSAIYNAIWAGMQ